MSVTRKVDQTDVICGLKTAVTTLERNRNAQISKEQRGKIESKITSPPVYIIIPIQDVKVDARGRKLPSKFTYGTVKDVPCPLRKIRSRCKKKIDQCEKTSRLIFPEMRAGILYSRCCCLHRNGLQDHCPLSQCQGQPECLAKPWAVCPPAKFIRLRHPELYPKASDTDCIA